LEVAGLEVELSKIKASGLLDALSPTYYSLQAGYASFPNASARGGRARRLNMGNVINQQHDFISFNARAKSNTADAEPCIEIVSGLFEIAEPFWTNERGHVIHNANSMDPGTLFHSMHVNNDDKTDLYIRSGFKSVADLLAHLDLTKDKIADWHSACAYEGSIDCHASADSIAKMKSEPALADLPIRYFTNSGSHALGRITRCPEKTEQFDSRTRPFESVPGKDDFTSWANKAPDAVHGPWKKTNDQPNTPNW
jgi:hypothetical protein